MAADNSYKELLKKVKALEQEAAARKKAEAHLKAQSETKFRSVAQSAKDAIITADAKGNIAFCNTAADKMFGYREGELIGQSISVLMPQRFRAAHESGMTRVAASGKSRLINKTVELYGITKDGREFPVELSLSNWKSGDHTFYAGIIRDISERKQHEKEREALIDNLKTSLAKVRKLSTTGDTGIKSRPTSGIIRKPNSATASVRNAPVNFIRNIIIKNPEKWTNQTKIDT
jgi:PAS domain S-box-containing protein